MRRFEGRIVLITGGSSGIGRATALAFAAEGATVIVTDIDEEKGKALLTDITASGGAGRFFRQDVSRGSSHDEIVDAIVAEFGHLDIAFNNAGIGGKLSPIADYHDEDWERVISVNLSGVFFGMRAQIRQMLRQHSGVIINNSSILGVVSFEGTPAYTATKHALIGLTRSAALDYSSKGIRVNAIGPAFIRTPMLDNSLDEQTLESLSRMHPVGRLGSAEEVAKAVLFLASEDASFITGETLMVDGGYIAR